MQFDEGGAQTRHQHRRGNRGENTSGMQPKWIFCGFRGIPGEGNTGGNDGGGGSSGGGGGSGDDDDDDDDVGNECLPVLLHSHKPRSGQSRSPQLLRQGWWLC